VFKLFVTLALSFSLHKGCIPFESGGPFPTRGRGGCTAQLSACNLSRAEGPFPTQNYHRNYWKISDSFVLVTTGKGGHSRKWPPRSARGWLVPRTRSWFFSQPCTRVSIFPSDRFVLTTFLLRQPRRRTTTNGMFILPRLVGSGSPCCKPGGPSEAK